jgi:hypothetical protein
LWFLTRFIHFSGKIENILAEILAEKQRPYLNSDFFDLDCFRNCGCFHSCTNSFVQTWNEYFDRLTGVCEESLIIFKIEQVFTI